MTGSNDDELRKNLKEGLDEAQWDWLNPHHLRGAMILVSQDLDLLSVGEMVALDAKFEVQSWLKKGKLSRPTPQQIETWSKTPEKKFRCLIVQPWVLVQEQLLH